MVRGRLKLLPRNLQVVADGSPDVYRYTLGRAPTRRDADDNMLANLRPGLVGDVTVLSFGTVDQENYRPHRGKRFENGQVIVRHAIGQIHVSISDPMKGKSVKVVHWLIHT